MGEEYKDPFEAFRQKKQKKDVEKKAAGQPAADDPAPQIERPQGFTTNRYSRTKFGGVPGLPQQPAAPQGKDGEFFPEDAGSPAIEKPDGFVSHKFKKPQKPKAGEIKKPAGFKSHKFK